MGLWVNEIPTFSTKSQTIQKIHRTRHFQGISYFLTAMVVANKNQGKTKGRSDLHYKH